MESKQGYQNVTVLLLAVLVIASKAKITVVSKALSVMASRATTMLSKSNNLTGIKSYEDNDMKNNDA